MDFHITYYETAMVRLDIGPFRLLTDPVLDPPGRVYAFPSYRLEKLAGTRDRTALVDAIGPIDAILLTHAQHRDNLDEAGRALLYATPKAVTTVASAWSLSRRRPAESHTEMVGLHEWESHVLTQYCSLS